MAKRSGEKIEELQAKRHQADVKSPFQLLKPSELFDSKSVVSSTTEDSEVENDTFKGISFAQDPADDSGDDFKPNDKPCPPSSAKPLPQLTYIKPALMTLGHNKPIVTPEKPKRQISWNKDLPTEDLRDKPILKSESDRDMGKNLFSHIINYNKDNSGPAYRDNECNLIGNSGYIVAAQTKRSLRI